MALLYVNLERWLTHSALDRVPLRRSPFRKPLQAATLSRAGARKSDGLMDSTAGPLHSAASGPVAPYQRRPLSGAADLDDGTPVSESYRGVLAWRISWISEAPSKPERSLGSRTRARTRSAVWRAAWYAEAASSGRFVAV